MDEPGPNDLYALLGVARDAQPREIRRAYRRLARRHHPDLNAQLEGSEQFVRLANAYEILHDPARRARYDRTLRQVVVASKVASNPTGRGDDAVPPTPAGMRRGILELSCAEALRVARHPLALHDARGGTILLPAGTRHGDRITVIYGCHRVVLTVAADQRT